MLRVLRPSSLASLLLVTLLLTAAAGTPGAEADADGRPAPTGATAGAGASPSPWLVDPSARGAAGRVPPESYTDPDFHDVPAACYTPEATLSTDPCRLVPRKPGAPLIVLWGDSHAWQMTPALRRAVRGKRVNVIAFIQGACPVMNSDLSTPRAYAERNGCDEFGHAVLDFIDRVRKQPRPVRVVVSMAWELYHNVTDPPNAADERYPGFTNDYIELNARKSLRGTPRAFRALGRMGVPTDVVAQQPMNHMAMTECPAGAYRCAEPRWAMLKDAAENNARVRQLRSLLTRRGLLIRPAKSLCDTRTCYGEYQGVPTYYDRIHLGQRTSYRLAPHFQPSVGAVLRAAARR